MLAQQPAPDHPVSSFVVVSWSRNSSIRNLACWYCQSFCSAAYNNASTDDDHQTIFAVWLMLTAIHDHCSPHSRSVFDCLLCCLLPRRSVDRLLWSLLLIWTDVLTNEEIKPLMSLAYWCWQWWMCPRFVSLLWWATAELYKEQHLCVTRWCNWSCHRSASWLVTRCLQPRLSWGGMKDCVRMKMMICCVASSVPSWWHWHG